jgi:hypothetical protein
MHTLPVLLHFEHVRFDRPPLHPWHSARARKHFSHLPISVPFSSAHRGFDAVRERIYHSATTESVNIALSRRRMVKIALKLTDALDEGSVDGRPWPFVSVPIRLTGD